MKGSGNKWGVELTLALGVGTKRLAFMGRKIKMTKQHAIRQFFWNISIAQL